MIIIVKWHNPIIITIIIANPIENHLVNDHYPIWFQYLFLHHRDDIWSGQAVMVQDRDRHAVLERVDPVAATGAAGHRWRRWWLGYQSTAYGSKQTVVWAIAK